MAGFLIDKGSDPYQIDVRNLLHQLKELVNRVNFCHDGLIVSLTATVPFAMADVLTPDQRRRCMSAIRGKNTKPELVVRRLVHRMGYRFRLHRKDLPGKPDILLPRHRKIIFVHGCFWHQHPRCRFATRPSTRKKFWAAKLDGNVERDRRNRSALERLGWKVFVVWECQCRSLDTLERRIVRFLDQ